MGKTLVTYSSLTGNTEFIAKNIFDIIEGEKEIISLNDIKNIDIDSFDTFVIGYWVDKGNADGRTKKFLKGLSGKNIAMFGTLGAAPDSEHGKKVHEKIEKLCENNNQIGSFLCRGKIDPKLVEKMGKFPLKLIHPLTPERLQRIEEAKPHPNQDDALKAQEYFKNILNK